MDCPVMALDCSEHRKSAARAISSAVCARPCSTLLKKPFNCSSALMPRRLAKSAPNSFDMRVPVTGPGQMAFTRTPFWAASAAVERVRPSIPALAAAYAEAHKYAALAEGLEL